jgi:hypothetical protein
VHTSDSSTKFKESTSREKDKAFLFNDNVNPLPFCLENEPTRRQKRFGRESHGVALHCNFELEKRNNE